VALALVDGLAVANVALVRHGMWHAVRADLLRRLDRPEEAVAAYEAAIDLTGNTPERAFLQRRRDSLGSAR
jgi:RNA polymerase sigma-70 factor, ECF subfamily